MLPTLKPIKYLKVAAALFVILYVISYCQFCGNNNVEAISNKVEAICGSNNNSAKEHLLLLSHTDNDRLLNNAEDYLLLSVTELQRHPYLLHPLPLNVRKLVEDIKLGIKPVIAPINTYNYTTILRCDNVCSENVKLLVLVKANPANIKHRRRIRTTWNHSSDQHKIIFVTGINRKYNFALLEENELHKDILQFEFEDTYENLTLKTMLSFKWVAEYCLNVPHVALIDDDVDLWIDNVLSFYKSTRGKEKYFYGGYVHKLPLVYRSNNRQAISFEEYAFNVNPDFTSGCCSFFTAALINELYYASLYTQFIKNQDVYIGILAAKLNFPPIELNKLVVIYVTQLYSENTTLCKLLQLYDH